MEISPKLSVIMPVFNAEMFLKEAIKSILKQSFSDFELIIIDDFSEDQSVNIIKQFCDNRICLIENQVNIGCWASRKIGIQRSRGIYIAFMDADDIALKNRFQQQIKFLEKNPNIGICGTWVRTIGDSSNIWMYPLTHDYIKVSFVFNNPFANPTVMFRRSVIELNEIQFDPDFVVSEDYDFFDRFLYYSEGSNIPEILLLYRLHNNQIGQKSRTKQDELAQIIRGRVLSKAGIPFNQQELEQHSKYLGRGCSPTPEILQWASQWLAKIEITNNLNNFFNKRALHDVLSSQWFKLCKNGSYMGFSCWKIYYGVPYANVSFCSKKGLLFFINVLFHDRIRAGYRKIKQFFGYLHRIIE